MPAIMPSVALPGQLDQPAVELARRLGKASRLPSGGDVLVEHAVEFVERRRCVSASVSRRTAIGSMPERAVITSEIVAPDSSSRRPAGRATISGPGTRTRAPVREPRRTSTSRSDSSTRTASRSVGLLTPKCAISSASLGR